MTGQVTSERAEGIGARNGATATDLTIETAGVAGGSFGVVAINERTGAVAFTHTGEVTAQGNDGIRAINSANGTDPTITAQSVSGCGRGIYAFNQGSGLTKVTATGPVTGTNVTGIEAIAGGTDLTIEATEVDGVGFAVSVDKTGGSVSITTTGDVRARNSRLIPDSTGLAVTHQSGTSLNISTTSVSGPAYGIGVYAGGSGTATIKSTGTVTAAGVDGINLVGGPAAQELILEVNTVQGGRHGIQTQHSGTRGADITVTGAVQGGTGVGITNTSASETNSDIDLRPGSSVQATSGNAIVDGDGDMDLFIDTGASVAGTIRLGDGDDSIFMNGSILAGVTELDGGAGLGDTLVFIETDDILDGAILKGMEEISIEEEASIEFIDTLIADVIVETDGLLFGTNTIDGSLSIGSGGTIRPGTSPGTQTVLQDFNLLSDATAEFELGGLTQGILYDFIDVAGTATLEDGAFIEIQAYQSYIPQTGNIFNLLRAGTILANVGFLGFRSRYAGGSFELRIIDDGLMDILQLEVLETPRAIPLPPALALLGTGLLGLGMLCRRRRKRADEMKCETAIKTEERAA